MASALVAPLFLISGSCGFVMPPAEEYQLQPLTGPRGLSWEARRDILKRWDIIPDVIDEMPPHELKLRYQDGFTPNFGDRLWANWSSIQTEPLGTWWPIDSNFTLYTMAMIDPDMPTPGNREWREYRNWLVGNVPGNATFAGEIISHYQPPEVIYPSGGHRLLFLIYKQKEEINFEEQLSDERPDRSERRNFSIKKFAEKYDLGKPIACMFFMCTWFIYII